MFYKRNKRSKQQLRLDGTEYDKRKKQMVCFITKKGFRNPLKLPISDVLQEETIIELLSPIDAFLLGILSSPQNQHKNIDYITLCKIKKHINFHSEKKFECLKVTEKDYDANPMVITLTNLVTEKKIELNLNALLDNIDIISLVSPSDALSLACDFNLAYS